MQEQLPEPGCYRSAVVAFPEHGGRGGGHDESAPFLFQLLERYAVHPAVFRIHYFRAVGVHAVEDDIVQPSVFLFKMHYHRLGGVPQVQEPFLLGLQAHGVESKLAACVDYPLKCGAVLGSAAGLPDTEQRKPQPVVCADRGYARRGTVVPVVLSDFYLLLHGLPSRINV